MQLITREPKYKEVIVEEESSSRDPTDDDGDDEIYLPIARSSRCCFRRSIIGFSCALFTVLTFLWIYFIALVDHWPTGGSFPGMNDTTTCMEGCSARIIAQLYHAWKKTQKNDHNTTSWPFTPILYQRNYKNESVIPPPSAFLESTEIMIPSHSCPFDWADSQCRNLSYFMHTCPTSEDPMNPYFMTGFTFYTDGAMAMETLSWDHRPCSAVLDAIDGPREIIEKNIPLVHSTDHGYRSNNKEQLKGNLIVFRERYESRNYPVGPTIYISDPTSDSCWMVDCGISYETEENDGIPRCVEDAQLGLVKVSIPDFVNNLKGIWCE